MSVFRKLAVVALALCASAAVAQVTPAQGVTPPDDTPKVNIGATIFAQYVYQDSPTITDADKNTVHFSAFDVTRAYINVIGNLNHILGFRITPDITRETGTGSSLNGSLTFRLKYAFGQMNLDDWTTHGSWLRLGIQQTPYIDYTEGIYRYRFQGPIFVDREGFMSSSDAGFSGHWNMPGNFGDIHAGFYNGENYNHTETNNQKAFQVRASVRPLPLGGDWKGLRITGYVDSDAPVQNGKRDRYIGQVTFEHPLANAGFEYLDAKNKALSASPSITAKGWSAWVTPRLGTTGWEALLRHDSLKPNDTQTLKRNRNIVGIAYWFQHLTRVTSALMVDYDSLKQTGVTPVPPNQTNYGVHMLVNF